MVVVKKGGGVDEQMRPTLPSFLSIITVRASDARPAVSMMMQGIWLIILDELWWLYGVHLHGLAKGAATLHSQRPSRRTEGDQTGPTEGSSHLPSRVVNEAGSRAQHR